jgi:hypothetical protein
VSEWIVQIIYNDISKLKFSIIDVNKLISMFLWKFKEDIGIYRWQVDTENMSPP